MRNVLYCCCLESLISEEYTSETTRYKSWFVGCIENLRRFSGISAISRLPMEAGDNQSLKIQVARPGIEPRTSCSASQELNHSTSAAPTRFESPKWINMCSTVHPLSHSKKYKKEYYFSINTHIDLMFLK